MLNLHLLECTVKGYDHISDLLLAKYWVITGCKYRECELSKLVIPDSVIEIGFGAFGSSSSLRELTIGKNVQTIYGLAFDASNLVYIYCKADIPPALFWSANVSSIYDENSALIIYVPRSAYNEYVSYSSRKDGFYKDNWCMYKSRISPYDF